jgi:L-2,4-diaminobutyric acid acetyltransferase
MALFKLIKQCPPLDLNSSYLYFLQASHFAQTCRVAEQNGALVGFVSGYRHPQDAEHLFIWQVAIAPACRGQGLAKQLLLNLLHYTTQQAPLRRVSCTISPSNQASQALFKSIARQFNLALHVSDFITAEHFDDQPHEAEQTYCLQGFDAELSEFKPKF